MKLGEQFNPLAIGGSGKFDLPLVFVGYGITAKDDNYDDYAGIDVKDKAVIILRHEPQQANPHSVFDGTKTSPHAPFRRKVSNAYEHGAAAVIFCNDEFDVDEERRRSAQALAGGGRRASPRKTRSSRPSPSRPTRTGSSTRRRCKSWPRTWPSSPTRLRRRQDPLLPFDGAGPDAAEGRNFPVLSCRRSVLDEVIKAALGTTLDKLEAEIDKGPTPHSRALDGWRAEGETSVDRQEAEVKNVVGVLEGEGPHADETIVIGAHYDHLGHGGAGSAAPGVNEIHNGADDNGSGTTVLIEVARATGRAQDEAAAADGVHRLHGRRARADRQRALRAQSAVSARHDRGHAQPGHGRPPAGRKADRARHRHGRRNSTRWSTASARSSAFRSRRSPAASGPATTRRFTRPRFRCCSFSPAATRTITGPATTSTS